MLFSYLPSLKLKLFNRGMTNEERIKPYDTVTNKIHNNFKNI